MKIEGMTVKMLRSGKRYSNDTTGLYYCSSCQGIAQVESNIDPAGMI